MNTVVIDKAGLLSTIQDSGRRGMRHLGIPWSGTLVPVWQRMANALVGNELDHSIIECFEGGLEITVRDAPIRLAIMADSQAKMSIGNEDGAEVLQPYRSHIVMPGKRIILSSTGNARLAIIAIAGLQVSKQLGSTSTYAKASLGGISGDPLIAGDVLNIAADNANTDVDKQCKANQLPDYQSNELRVVLGPQDDNFSKAGIQTFLTSDYTLSVDVDRMGARLEGTAIEHRDKKARDPVSDAIAPGSIQVPGSGLPIVLLSDAHTAGGYPKIATVLSIDLPLLGLQRPGAVFRFKALSIDEAIDATRKQHRLMTQAITDVTPVIEQTLSSEVLLKLNLIGGVVDGNNP
jgi:biotin-dependent carboxylase-like uncharacterized protein